MSKSTPLAELQNNVATNSTKPLVQDILKEIEQEEHNPNMGNNTHLANSNGSNMPVELSHANMSSEMPSQLNSMQMADTSDNVQYAQQQEQALQYQLDSNVNAQENTPSMGTMGSLGPNEQLDSSFIDPNYHGNNATSINDLNSMGSNMLQANDLSNMRDLDPVRHKTMAQKIIIEAREPLLVMLISILLSVPVINSYLAKLVTKFAGKHLHLAGTITKGLLAALLFYFIRKLF